MMKSKDIATHYLTEAVHEVLRARRSEDTLAYRQRLTTRELTYHVCKQLNENVLDTHISWDRRERMKIQSRVSRICKQSESVENVSFKENKAMWRYLTDEDIEEQRLEREKREAQLQHARDLTNALNELGLHSSVVAMATGDNQVRLVISADRLQRLVDGYAKRDDHVWVRWFYVSNWGTLQRVPRDGLHEYVEFTCSAMTREDFRAKARFEIIDGDITYTTTADELATKANTEPRADKDELCDECGGAMETPGRCDACAARAS